jgi:ABC-type taurine transport system ATPase subunit
MTDNLQNGFIATELDPDLLSAPFGVQTNWHVITGAASCGKTTLIDLLADQGFQTVPETARLYIERERWPKGERSMRFARMRSPWNTV